MAEKTSSDAVKLQKEGVPEGLWMRCPECGDMLFRKVVEEALHVCPGCQYHFRVSARMRIEQIADPNCFEERHADLEPADPLKFVDKKAYKDRLRDEQREDRKSRCRRLRQGVHQGPADHDGGHGSRPS